MINHSTACYALLVCTLGLTLLCSLAYGLTLSEDTVSHNMLTNIPYRVIISSCIVLQLSFWVICMYSKTKTDPDTAAWGLACTGITIASWMGLSTMLTGTPHDVFVCIFVLSFLIDLLVLCTLTWQRMAVEVLTTSIAFQLICIVIMMVLYNNKEFYIMEHVAFISYSLIFTVFFLVHTPADWGAQEDGDNEYTHTEYTPSYPITPRYPITPIYSSHSLI
jgi:hypothetical protein